MTAEEKHDAFMVNARCCYAKMASCIADKKLKGIKVRLEDIYELKLLYLLSHKFLSYNTVCVTEAQYEYIYNAITDICDFCNCSQTITS